VHAEHASTVPENNERHVARKMNIVFWVSSMPNQRMVSGISAAIGMLRRTGDRRQRRFEGR